jgi:uncharacterized tellurite resistance protein B-like protein
VLGSLKRLFEERVAPETARSSPEAREHGLRLAAAALLFEVIRADATVKAELAVMRRPCRAISGSRATGREPVRLAERRCGAPRHFTSSRLVDRELPFDDKRLVRLLWLVAFADAEKDAQEEHIVRQVAGLLHVPHPDFIDAKIRARAQSGLDKG